MRDDRARDKTIDKLVADKLRAQLQDRGEGCLNAETLAAYVERTLTQTERQTCEAHLAACSRCQEQVAELVRLSEAEEPVEVGARAPVGGRKIPWFRWALAAPALVALVVAGLWYTGEFRPLLRQQEQQAVKAPPPPQPVAPSVQPREERAATAPAAPGEVATAPSPEGKKEVPKQLARQVAAAPEAPAPTAAGAAEAGLPVSPAESPAKGAIATPGTRERLAGAPPSAARAAESLSIAAQDHVKTEATPVAPHALAAKAEPETGGERETLGRGQALSEKSRAFGVAAPMAGLARSMKAAATGPAADWRVGPRGLIQHRDSDGKWVTRASGVNADLFDITFPTPSAGWAVGEAGTVLRTTDGGNTWREITVPTQQDLVRVTATGELSARVVTREGAALATTDGGQSWKAAPQD
jgi:hypothetical protein